MKNLKRIFYVVIALVFAIPTMLVSLSSCGPDDDTTPQASLDVTPSELNISSSKDEQKITIKSNSKWIVQNTATWISVSSNSGEGDANITIYVDENTKEDRKTIVTFTTTSNEGSVTKTVTVNQKGKDNGGGGTSITTSSISLKAGYVYTIPNGAGLVWESSNPFIATVDDNVITANKVGTTKVTTKANGGKTIIVTVEATFDSYDEPYLQWGATKSMVKSANSNLQIYDESSTELYYTGKKQADKVNYSFENGKLYLATVFLKSSAKFSEIQDYLWERYISLGTEEGIYLFATLDANTMILWFNSENAVMYAEVPDEAKTRSVNQSDMRTIIEKCKRALKQK